MCIIENLAILDIQEEETQEITENLFNFRYNPNAPASSSTGSSLITHTDPTNLCAVMETG